VPKKVTAQTPWGPVSRSTVRTYTHVVVSFELQPGVAERWLARDIKNVESNIAYYQSVLKTGETASKYWTLEQVQRDLDDAEMRLAKLTLDRVHGRQQLIAHGWCGRLDLAQKLQAKACADGYLAEIFPLD